MVCPKCGKQFEGAFCPWCGSSAESAELEKRSDEEIAAEEEAFKAEETFKAEEEKKSAEQDAAQKQAEEAAVASGEKIRCPKCGNVFSGNFCPACGAKAIEVDRCPVCGAPHNAGDKFCAKCGYSYEKKPSAAVTMAGIGAAIKNSCKSALAFCKKHSKKVIAAAVAIALILVIVVPISVVFTSPVQPANVDRIKIGDTQERVLSILGDPYDWEEGDLTFDYYSNNYLKIRTQLDEIANMDDMESFGDLADALEKEEKLNAKLETLEYKQTRVSFDEDGLVTKVVYNASIIGNESQPKEFKSSKTTTKDIFAYEESNVAYTLKYKDGSICKGTTTILPEPASIDNLTYPFKYNYEIYDPFSLTSEKITITCDVIQNPNISYITTIDGVTYTLGVNGTLTISGTGIISGKGIASDESIKSLVIGEGITGIIGYHGNYNNYVGSFYNCDELTSITVATENPVYYSSGNCVIEKESQVLVVGCSNSVIPNDGSVSVIGLHAFYNCSGLKSITIPESVTSIGYRAFYGCSGLTSITVGQDNTIYHSAGNCLIKTESKNLIVGCNNSVIPNDGSVTSINSYAFYGCSGLASITIPDTVTSIGQEAFYNCSGLTSITIPDSVTSIGSNAFNGCSGLIQEENGVNYVDKWVVDYDKYSTQEQVQLRDNTVGIIESDNNGLFGVALRSIIIPDSVITIGRYAFINCSSLTSVNIYDGVKSIGDWAFGYCESLTSIVIPDSVTSIGSSAFDCCSGLASITIPDSVTSIGEYAFRYCYLLTSITFQGTMAQWRAMDNNSIGWSWNSNVSTIICTDGVLDKYGDQVS